MLKRIVKTSLHHRTIYKSNLIGGLANASIRKINMNKKINVLCAFDKFKDSSTARGVGDAVIDALKSKWNIEGVNIPLSDGGEGFLLVLDEVFGLNLKKVSVTGPLGNKIEAEYGQSKDGKFAVIEMATTSGLELVPKEKRDPYHTTTRGLGEIILDAYQDGYKKILLGIGGSATVDGGLGALQALGLKITCKRDGKLYEPKIFMGEDLVYIDSIEMPKKGMKKLIPDLTIDVACDVQNPLIGELGAVNVFGKQKGATKEQQIELEKGMVKFAELMKPYKDVSNVPGAGAAGGVGGSFHAILGANMERGIQLIADYVGLEDAVKKADIVFTGEGSYDTQTKQGKVPSLVQELCKTYNKPSVVICGRNASGETDQVYDLLSMFSFEESMTKTRECLKKLVLAKMEKMPVFGELIHE